MRKRILGTLCVALLMVFFVGCAGKAPTPTPFDAYNLSAKVKSGQYVPKVDNFMVILDGSHSMIDAYKGQRKFNQAWNLAYRLNQTIPNMQLVGALRTFGATPCPFRKNTTLVYGVAEYSRQAFEDGLKAVNGPGGVSPLCLAMNEAVSDLNSTQGQIAVIIFSDFKDMEATVVQAAENLKSQFPGRICIYPVLIGDDPNGKSLQEKMVQTLGCGFPAIGDEIYANGDMANFVESVFFEKAVDSDGDGVTDNLDQCPNTPRGVAVDAKGCPLDSDGDGVLDTVDQCPGTPRCATVNEVGCWVVKGVMFDVNKANIKSEFAANLNQVVGCIKQYPNISIEIQGHTDSTGLAAYNHNLSQKRANAVMQYFIQNGIAKERLKAVGYGASKPVASNNTKEGRAQNRRVQIKAIY